MGTVLVPMRFVLKRQPRAKHSSGSHPSVMPGGARTLAWPGCSQDRGVLRLVREIPTFPRAWSKGMVQGQDFQGNWLRRNGVSGGYGLKGTLQKKKGAGRGKRTDSSERQHRRSDMGGFAVSPAPHIQQPWSGTLIHGSLLHTAS